MGLRLELFRNDYNSNFNLLGNVTDVVVTNVDGPFEPRENAPAVTLVNQATKYDTVGIPVIVPDIEYLHSIGRFKNVPVDSNLSHGGSYAATSDSRFSRALMKIGPNGYFAVPVHDYSLWLEDARKKWTPEA